MIGLGILVRAFCFFLAIPTRRSVLDPGWSPLFLVCLLLVRPADPPTQNGAMVWVIGPLNSGTGLKVFRFLFLLSCRRPPQLRGGGGAEKSGYSNRVCFVFFPLSCTLLCFLF